MASYSAKSWWQNCQMDMDNLTFYRYPNRGKGEIQFGGQTSLQKLIGSALCYFSWVFPIVSLVTVDPKKGGLQEFMACPNMYRIATKIMHISGILGGGKIHQPGNPKSPPSTSFSQ